MSNSRGEFAETMKKDWVVAAAKELNNEDPIAKLSYRKGDLTILPYYDAGDVKDQRQNGQLYHGKPWVNAPKVNVDDAELANREALTHLQAGADGILFDIRSPSSKPARLLDGIELEFCSIFFKGNVSKEFLEQFATYSSRKFDSKKVKGAVYGLTIHDYGHVHSRFGSFTQFNTLGIENSSDCFDSNSLAQIFLEVQARLSHGEKSPALTPATILINLSDDFFGEIIRIRALNVLWSAFCTAYQQQVPLTMHCHSQPFEDPAFKPHGNMIAAASRSVSAIIGGAQVLTIDPETQDPLATRTARNISFLLDEEVHLSKAASTGDGSYFIDAASHDLAEQTWKLFKAGL